MVVDVEETITEVVTVAVLGDSRCLEDVGNRSHANTFSGQRDNQEAHRT